MTVVEMLPELAADMGFRDRFRLLSRITELPITFITNAKCRTIQEGGVGITKANKEEFVEADTVVLAVGTKPSNSFFPLLRAEGFETCLAGDCWHVGRIAQAISDGLRLGSVL